MAQGTNVSREFEVLIGEIFTLFQFEVFPPAKADDGFDVMATFDDVEYAIEAKYYRSATPDLTLIETAAKRLSDASKRARIERAFLATSNAAFPDFEAQIFARYNVVILSRETLLVWAARSSVLAEKFMTLLEMDIPEDIDRLIEITPSTPQEFFSSNRLAERPRRSEPPSAEMLKAVFGEAALRPDAEAKALITGLKAIKPGNEFFKDYEQHVTKILKFLFNHDLVGWREQNVSVDGLNRTDVVCRIRSRSSFWNFLAIDLQSRYVVFEFKNYNEKVGQSQILTTEKYLMSKALRNIGVIVCRKGASVNAKTMMQGAMREQGKLMIVLSDEDIVRMLQLKQRGDNPSELLFELVDEFLLSLPR